MAYNPNIPQPTDIPATSQGQILGNFQSIKTTFDVNHVDFNAGVDAGKHKFVSFPVQAGSPATSATEVALFSKVSAITGAIGLNIQYQNRLAGSSTIDFTNNGPGVSGWTYLPSGILVKWGTTTANGNTPYLFPVVDEFAVVIPAFSGLGFLPSIQLTVVGGAATDTFVYLTSINPAGTGFTAYGSERTGNIPAATTFYWLAIGV